MICFRLGSSRVGRVDKVFSRIRGVVEQALVWGARNFGASGVSGKKRKAPFGRLRANGSSLEIMLVSSAHAGPQVSCASVGPVVSPAHVGPVVSFAPAGPKVFSAHAEPEISSAHAEPVEAPKINEYYEPTL
ncbi:MAG: hypothetical protein KKH22_09605 [Proteobacteria bacterium]|nr:hypothetical protein [Pseudomonadota bacterium]